jgi:hypothetical protein
MADMVFRSGEAREAGGRFRGVLFLDGKPEGRRSEDVEVHRPVEAGKGAPVLRRAAEGLASVPEGLVQGISTQGFLIQGAECAEGSGRAALNVPCGIGEVALQLAAAGEVTQASVREQRSLEGKREGLEGGERRRA